MSTPKPHIVIQGLGQMGATFAHAALRSGATVTPIVRDTDMAALAEQLPSPDGVVIAVGEADLHGAVTALPPAYRRGALLLQNELLPGTVRRTGLEDPTVAVVWFEKKAHTGLKPIIPTPIAGPAAEAWVARLNAIGATSEVISEEQLPFEMVAKNAYILTANLAGLRVGGTVGALLADHGDLAESVLREVVAVQSAQLDADGDDGELDLTAVRLHFERAVSGDPEHSARGRSAPARRARFLAQASQLGVPTPTVAALPES